jgi:hypothetical protein
MSLKLGKPKMPPSEPRKDEERETREAVVQDADKTEGKDRDLLHGDGGTLGLGGAVYSRIEAMAPSRQIASFERLLCGDLEHGMGAIFSAGRRPVRISGSERRE